MARRRGSPRVFLGPIEIAGVFRGLEQGLREIGVDADAYDISADPFSYRRPANGGAPSIRRTIWARRQAGRARRALARLSVFVRAVLRYDVFVIGGTGFWGGHELILLRRLGKQTVWVFLGSDHRPPYLNGKNVRRGLNPERLRRETARVARRVARVERWADQIIAHEASAQFHTRSFVRLLEIGLPMRVDQPPAETAIRGAGPGDALTVVHCPTDPVAKGSAEIRAMVERVRTSGVAIDYREIVGRPHEEVLAAVARADLVIDELYSDTPLGALSAEAAWFGTAPLCGGYLAGLLKPLSERAELPLSLVDPAQFEDRLGQLLTDHDARRERGLAARAFVRMHWSPRSVAERLRRVIGGSCPSAWLIDPRSITYVDGYGMPRETRRAGVRGLVTSEGTAALCLRHRPDLCSALLDD